MVKEIIKKEKEEVTKPLTLEEGRKLAVQIFDRTRPQYQKLSGKDRERLSKLRIKISNLIKELKKPTSLNEK